MRFSQVFLSLAFSLLPVVAPAAVAEDYSTLKKIEAIGAQLTRDEAKPGNPVVEVVWNNPAATDQGVKKLFELLDPGRIRVLNLGETGYGAPITDAALVHLKRMDRLEKLYLDNTAITDHGLIHLKKLDRLKELHLNSTGITDDGLRRLQGLRSLRILSVVNTEVTDEAIAEFKKAMPRVSIIRAFPPQPPPERPRDYRPPNRYHGPFPIPGTPGWKRAP